MANINRQIHKRFMEVMSIYVGIDKKYSTKRAFGEVVGLLPQEINWLETGERKLQFRHLVALHKNLGIDLNWFIAGTKQNKNSDKRTEKIRENIKKMVDQI